LKRRGIAFYTALFSRASHGAEQSTNGAVSTGDSGISTQMCQFKSFAASAMCSAALILSSCGTTGSNRYVAAQIAEVPRTIVAENLTPTTDATQVTIGNLTDPCTLGMDDPWWIDHGGRVEFHRRCG
jgi:hypothetical protein